MKRPLLYPVVLLIMLLTSTTVSAADGKWDYDIEGVGTGVQDTYLVKVTVVSKKPSLDDETFKRCAIHGILFRGFESEQFRQKQKPMIEDAQTEQAHKAFFDSFFNGDLSPYAEIVEDSRQIRMKNKKYHITVTIQIYKEKLRHQLENDGIIKRLTDGFE